VSNRAFYTPLQLQGCDSGPMACKRFAIGTWALVPSLCKYNGGGVRACEVGRLDGRAVTPPPRGGAKLPQLALVQTGMLLQSLRRSFVALRKLHLLLQQRSSPPGGAAPAAQEVGQHAPLQ